MGLKVKLVRRGVVFPKRLKIKEGNYGTAPEIKPVNVETFLFFIFFNWCGSEGGLVVVICHHHGSLVQLPGAPGASSSLPKKVFSAFDRDVPPHG